MTIQDFSLILIVLKSWVRGIVVDMFERCDMINNILTSLLNFTFTMHARNHLT